MRLNHEDPRTNVHLSSYFSGSCLSVLVSCPGESQHDCWITSSSSSPCHRPGDRYASAGSWRSSPSPDASTHAVSTHAGRTRSSLSHAASRSGHAAHVRPARAFPRPSPRLLANDDVIGLPRSTFAAAIPTRLARRRPSTSAFASAASPEPPARQNDVSTDTIHGRTTTCSGVPTTPVSNPGGSSIAAKDLKRCSVCAPSGELKGKFAP